jgi:hypothetical protein
VASARRRFGEPASIANGGARAIFVAQSMSKAIPSEQGELFVASHDVLFEPIDQAGCDACGQPLPLEDDCDGYGIPGSGVYLWKRGDDVRLEKVPLCASCASAIGMTALARWEIEEEEG